MLNPKYQQKPNENWRDYGIRLIGTLIEQRPDDLEWQDIVDALNLNIHRDSLRKAQNTEFGGYAIYKYMLDKIDKLRAENQNCTTDEDYLASIKEERRKLENEKYKIRDERSELRRLQREESRRESFIDLIKRVLSDNIEPLPYSASNSNKCELAVMDKGAEDVDESTLIIPITDVHTGIVCKNSWNSYSSEELICRLHSYYQQICAIRKRHNAHNAVIVLGGDLISGIIYKNLRIENNENVIEQLKLISIYLTNFIKDLSEEFKEIKIYSVNGNHSRIMENKEEALKGEELDALIPFYMKASLQNFHNVHIFTENSTDDTMVAFKIYDRLWYAVHGTYDNPASVVQNLTMMTGLKPDGVLMGHKHTNALLSVHDTKVVQSGCLSGMDNYAIQKRLVNTSEQFIVVSTPNSTIECLYDVQLAEPSVQKAKTTIINSTKEKNELL